MTIKLFIKRWANRRSYKIARKEADRRRAKDFKKYLVIYLNGEFRCVSKQHLKTLHKNKVFKKGVPFHKIEKYAVYSTH
ncbi:MAG: hypothetical protein ACTHK8_18985 [Ginsengibacter sp.]